MYGKSCSHRRVAEKGGDVVAKLMEVIEKIPNFKKGTVTLKLLDTTFSQLTRKIGSQSGKLFQTVETRDMLSKEVLQSLNAYQLALKERLILWQQAYNTYIDSIKSKITDATHFNYTFTSLVDYTSKYVVNKTLADYYLLTEFVNAEKELYEFGHYWGKNHMINLLSQMKEWSKTRWYGSSVGEVGVEYETGRGFRWTIKEKAGFIVKTQDGGDTTSHDKCWLYISGFQDMKIGETRTVTVEAYLRRTQFDGPVMHIYQYGYIDITKISLGKNGNVDDGYYSFKAYHKDLNDGVRSAPRVTKWTGVGSPYFDIKNPTLQIIKALNLNVRGN